MGTHRKLTKREMKRRERGLLRRKRVKLASPRTYERPEEFITEASKAEDKKKEDAQASHKPAEDTTDTKAQKTEEPKDSVAEKSTSETKEASAQEDTNKSGKSAESEEASDSDDKKQEG